VYENAYILRGRGLSIRIGNIMDSSPRAGGEKRVSKPRQRLTIEAPVLLLGGGKLALLLLGILGPQHPVLEYGNNPDTSKAGEAET
jgi:hypothetical protein